METKTIQDIKRPLDLNKCRSEYADNSMQLEPGTLAAAAEAMHRVFAEPRPQQLFTYWVPVQILPTMANPLKPAKCYHFYKVVKAASALEAAHLACCLVKHQYATPKHSIQIDTKGIVSY